ncbi:unnamed protein product [Oppiella nova]|uniref:Carboxypeptidase n=1 Tax=Oppiella nova TaxID=334625 RepID=A0A7R9LP18_9ACAR|nr:unnamed protein product [Oppiella nova]CAG2165562.1 unnamed protein product [Oppiella nova]
MNTLLLFYILPITIYINCVYTANSDEIQNLPGLPEPVKFRQYSGYLNATKGRHHFYWYFESEQDPQNAPVVLWLNGGPMCSSLLGMFTEHGPYTVDSKGIKLTMNKYSWNKVVNIIYMESPAGAGFSYDENYPEPLNDNNTTAVANYFALESFFDKYPHLKKNAFYITGESYGGVYVPMLANEIFTRKSSINLQGIAIGNGLFDWSAADVLQVPTLSQYDFALGHGLISHGFYQQKISSCCSIDQDNKWKCDFLNPVNKTKCDSVKKEPVSIMNLYNIYSDCHLDMEPVNGSQYDPFYNPNTTNHKLLKQAQNTNQPDYCPHSGHKEYLNRADVRQALHVRNDAPKQWSAYKGEKGYTKVLRNGSQTFVDLIEKYRIGKILVYNGDFDSICDFITDARFVEGLGYRYTEEYRPWTVDGKPDGVEGGFVQHYERGLSYLTVRGAGHAVPTYKPEAALQILKALLGYTKLNPDEILSLPRLDEPIKFRQYSDYLDSTTGRHQFYWYHESELDPENAPVVLWLNGGPILYI